jgi:hypothetical protein
MVIDMGTDMGMDMGIERAIEGTERGMGPPAALMEGLGTDGTGVPGRGCRFRF